jgi:surfactin synthase thioesterase subunit
MNTSYLIIIPAILFNLSCSKQQAAESKVYLPVTMRKCNNDSLNIYHFIIPEKAGEKIPLIIFLDSGGDGLLAVKKVEPAIAGIPCMVVGSDIVRNNDPGFVHTIEVLIEDVTQNFNISREQIYIGGFSGGARMAFEYARLHKLSGVLMCGAGFAVNSVKELPCPVYMIAGTTDFNFSEVYYNPLFKTESNDMAADYFRGGHAWPPAQIIEDGLLFLMQKSIPHGRRLTKRRSDLLIEQSDSLLAADEILLAFKAAEKAFVFNPQNARANKQMENMKSNQDVVGKINQIEKNLAQESRQARAYMNDLMDKDSLWWGKEIDYLTQEIKDSKADNKDHFMRIKGFMGILFYSRLNLLLRSQPGNSRILHILAAYRKAEPSNPDVYYDYALYYFKNNNIPPCKKYLSKAFSLGFSDQVKLKNDFPGLIFEEVRTQQE